MDDMISGFWQNLLISFISALPSRSSLCTFAFAHPTPDHKDGVPHAKHVTGSLAFRIKDSVKLYLITKVSLSFGLGLLHAYSPFHGVKMAAVFGLIAFCLDFIPNVGAIIATFIPPPMIFLIQTSV